MNLSDCINVYLADRKVKGIKPPTVRNEAQVLRLLLADVGNIHVHNLRPQHMDLFWSRRAGWAPGTLNRARHSLSVFFKWCEVRGHMPRGLDPMEGHRSLKVPPRNRIVIPQTEFHNFLDSAATPRDRIMLALGLYLFLRISEITNLRWQDLDNKLGTVEVFRQKTLELDTLPICTELQREVQRWRLAYAADVGQQPQPGWYVVPAKTRPRFKGLGKNRLVMVEPSHLVPTQRASLNRIMGHVIKNAGYYQTGEGGHTLRRSGAIALYNQLASVGHDRAIRICQAMLGHRSIATTEIYLRLDLDRKVRNDLLAGKPMFPAAEEAVVIHLRGSVGSGDDGAG